MSITGIAKGFDLPAGTELLAEGDDFPVQAFRSGHAFGFQFHPDVTYAMMHCWTTRGHDRMDAPGARPRHHHFADRAVHDVTERAWLKHFLDGWLAAHAAFGAVGSRGIERYVPSSGRASAISPMCYIQDWFTPGRRGSKPSINDIA